MRDVFAAKLTCARRAFGFKVVAGVGFVLGCFSAPKHLRLHSGIHLKATSATAVVYMCVFQHSSVAGVARK